MSHLKCPKCGKEFDYAFIPMVSMTSVRMGKSRYLRCPYCKDLGNFALTNSIKERHESEMLVDDRKPALILLVVVVVVMIATTVVLRLHAL